MREPQRRAKGDAIKKNDEDFEMRDEYEFKNPIRNPYVQRFQELNLVSLDADVKAAFPDSQSVNQALRLLIEAVKSAQEFQRATPSAGM